MKVQFSVASTVLAVLCLAVPVSSAGEGAHLMMTPADLTWTAVPSLPPGATLAVIEGPMNEAVPFTVRLRFPANYRIPPHWHPAVERVTVLSGAFHMGLGDRLDPEKSEALEPGSIMIMQPETHHFGWTREAAVIQLHGTGPWAITYVNPADDPRKK